MRILLNFEDQWYSFHSTFIKLRFLQNLRESLCNYTHLISAVLVSDHEAGIL